jgi:hypothetical protein
MKYSWWGLYIVKLSSFVTGANASDIELIHKEENN